MNVVISNWRAYLKRLEAELASFEVEIFPIHPLLLAQIKRK